MLRAQRPVNQPTHQQTSDHKKLFYTISLSLNSLCATIHCNQAIFQMLHLHKYIMYCKHFLPSDAFLQAQNEQKTFSTGPLSQTLLGEAYNALKDPRQGRGKHLPTRLAPSSQCLCCLASWSKTLLHCLPILDNLLFPTSVHVVNIGGDYEIGRSVRRSVCVCTR